MENLNIDEISQNSNLGDSNFFSFLGGESSVFKQFNENEKHSDEDEDEDNKSNFSFDSELVKQVGLLTEEEEDDLNEAKLNLENDDSNWSSLSVLKLSNNQHNMTTPVNKLAYNSESQDKSSIDNNKTFKNNPSSSIFNGMKSDKAVYNNLNSNGNIRKFSSNSFYNDNYIKTNSLNINNFMESTNNANKGNGILNLKQGFNMNLNNMNSFNKNNGINQSFDFHYN